MARYKDISGLKFGRLTAIKMVGHDKSLSALWLCVCDCGQQTVSCGADLRRGNTKSCKHHNDFQVGLPKSHGESVRRIISPELHAFNSAKARCNNPRKREWKWYGGRGVKFLFTNFAEFLESAGRRPSPQHSIDRINNNGHYEVGNVHWATSREQALNRNPKGYLIGQ
jgi:hypothetical protein